MSWLPSPAEVAGHPGRAFAGGLVAFALVLFLVHGFPSGTGLNTPVDVYAVARFSRNSLLPRRQVALYVALATPAGTALLRAVEGQTVAQTHLTYDAARGRRSPDWKPVAPAVREEIIQKTNVEVQRSWANFRATILVVDLLALLAVWLILWPALRPRQGQITD